MASDPMDWESQTLRKLWKAVEKEAECLVLTPERFGYESAGHVFNAMIDVRPPVILRLLRATEASKVVRMLTEAGVKFTVRGGGHSIAGTSVAPDAVMLDLSLLRRVTFDSTSGVATAEAGALWCDYDAVTADYGVGSTGGIVSHTGVAGLTLGGGLGWLMGEMGLACDRLIGVQAVDAQGRSNWVDESHPDLRLFRGAGRSLGLVTHFHFRPEPVPRLVTHGHISVPIGLTDIVIKAGLRAASDSPDWLTVSPAIVHREGVWCAVMDFVSTRGQRATHDALAELVPEPYGLLSEEVPYVVAQRKLDSALRFGRRNYWKSVALSGLHDGFSSELVDHVMRAPSTQTFVSVDVLHGQALREPIGGSSYDLRSLPLVVLFNTIWAEAEDDAVNVDWCSSGFSWLTSTSGLSRSYSNYFSRDDLGVQAGSTPAIAESARQRWTPPGMM